ncbi:MAG TPA: glycogen synthase GlgA [Candidatus Omnitrophota bacterium]|nr:glycogen synthase GlgA [Candidatus Omnitrophota bacterium]HPS20931.1 glycogen synthase GlgA [Candidatus Omnitrophota bacterium]
MRRPLKVLFVSTEAVPYAKVGGLADISSGLARALAAEGHDVRLIMPFYKCIDPKVHDIKKLQTNVRHHLSGDFRGFDIYYCEKDGLITYFIGKSRYFQRDEIYCTSRGDFPDNALRFSFFSKAVIAAIEAIPFKPDIIHCNDWQSALIPFFLKYKLSGEEHYTGIKTLFTIHNMAYQGIFSRLFMRLIGIPEKFFTPEGLEYYGKINFMKAGIIYADAINTVSKKYAEEVLTPEYGAGLDGLLRTREKEFTGISNGVDYDEWNPEVDKYIKINYGPDSIERKTECKKDLLEYIKMDLPIDRPLIGYVGRLVHQKGVDLIAKAAERMFGMYASLVILGRGSEENNRLFTKLAERYPDKIKFIMDFNEQLSHKIEAGCDMFLMPSRYEPCGLNQMYSLKYGTIPVVRATGGLDEVVVDVNEDPINGNGFKFGPMDEKDFVDAVSRAVNCFEDKPAWYRLMSKAMSLDFSWKSPAREYAKLYARIVWG